MLHYRLTLGDQLRASLNPLSQALHGRLVGRTIDPAVLALRAFRAQRTVPAGLHVVVFNPHQPIVHRFSSPHQLLSARTAVTTPQRAELKSFLWFDPFGSFALTPTLPLATPLRFH